MPRIEVTSDICLRRPRLTQGCRTDDDDDDDNDPLVQRVGYVLAHSDDLTFTRVSRSKPMLSLV